MTLVVDASVMVKWFYEEVGSDQARSLLVEDVILEAPVHAAAEVGHVLVRRVRDGVLPLAAMNDALLGLPRAVVLIPLETLHATAITLATETRVSYYDALYVAAAVEWRATLVTADARLTRMLALTRWTANLEDLSDWATARTRP